MTYLCCEPGEAERNLARIHAIQSKLEQDGVTADELEIAKNKICSHIVRQSERPSNRLFVVGNGWIQRHEYQTIQERLAAYQQVNLESIHRVLEQYPLTRNATVAVGPLTEIKAPQ